MSFLTTYYPKKITFERKGENVTLRPPDYKDWKSWSSLKEKNIDDNVKEKTIPKDKIGRNDPCYCGSGKKYKKCGLVDKCIKKS